MVWRRRKKTFFFFVFAIVNTSQTTHFGDLQNSVKIYERESTIVFVRTTLAAKFVTWRACLRFLQSTLSEFKLNNYSLAVMKTNARTIRFVIEKTLSQIVNRHCSFFDNIYSLIYIFEKLFDKENNSVHAKRHPTRIHSNPITDEFWRLFTMR